MSYRPRAIDGRLKRVLKAMGGVVLEGARGCGKTATGIHHSRSSIRLDVSPSAVALAELDPLSLLAGETPRLIDEWQLAPSLWNVIRHEIDDRRERGQFILAGSATPPDDIRRHSGAGRFGRVRLRTMTLSERGRSSNQVSLTSLAYGDVLSGIRSPLSYCDLATEAVRGGWPALIDSGPEEAREFNSAYLADLTSTDLGAATERRHDPARLRRLFASLARNVATEATLAKLTADVSADGSSLGRGTIRAYLDSLGAVFALEEQPAWSVSLRSRTRLRQQSRIHFSDPSLACAALNLTAERLSSDPEYFGQIFESMAIHDLRTQVEADAGRLFHYRDNTGLEVDAVTEFGDGDWAALEVKLGSSKIEEAERNLLRLREDRVDVARVGPPRFLAVITGTEHGFTLPSGVHVIPLACLSA